MDCSSYHNDAPTECQWQYFEDLGWEIEEILKSINANEKDRSRIMSLVMDILNELDSVIGDRHMDCPSAEDDGSSSSEDEVICTYNTYLLDSWGSFSVTVTTCTCSQYTHYGAFKGIVYHGKSVCR